MKRAGTIHVGIGGWNYEPWRTTFYPKEIPASRELEYASRQLSAIEINSTFYRLQKPVTYAKWRDSTPDGFRFTLKAPRFVTHRRRLADAGAAIDRFVDSGIAALEDRLGAVLWQLNPGHPFQPDDLEQFLQLLPPKAGACTLHHVMEVRHASFLSQHFIALLRRYRVAVACVDDAAYPGCADITSGLMYVRLRRSDAKVPTGYPLPALRRWAAHARLWASGAVVSGLPRVDPDAAVDSRPRTVFVFFINGAKERAPAAARALLSQVRRGD